MKKLVEAIAKALVDHLDDVHVRTIEGAQLTVWTIRTIGGVQRLL